MHMRVCHLGLTRFEVITANEHVVPQRQLDHARCADVLSLETF
jgi:hypothetical protein